MEVRDCIPMALLPFRLRTGRHPIFVLHSTLMPAVGCPLVQPLLCLGSIALWNCLCKNWPIYFSTLPYFFSCKEVTASTERLYQVTFTLYWEHWDIAFWIPAWGRTLYARFARRTLRMHSSFLFSSFPCTSFIVWQWWKKRRKVKDRNKNKR